MTKVTSLTRSQLQTIYTAGVLTVGTTRIIPCGIQNGSGTKSAWETAVGGGISGTEATAQNECNAISTTTDDNDGRLQESKAQPLVDKGNGAAANTQVIVGFSAANFIAQMNNVAPSTVGGPLAAGVDFGSVTNGVFPVGNPNAGQPNVIGKPYTATVTGASTVYSASSTYYNDTNFGRTIGYVLPGATVDEPGELEIKGMFTNLTGPAQICSATAQNTMQTFGFLAIATCGQTNLRGPYLVATASFPIPLS